ncbi:MAG: HAD-IC family P-type ATPase [Candidatus Hydrogenedens sp.]|nr:HAD-IC family P-type ATPase [Candidatus Hydrogenedens sp.]
MSIPPQPPAQDTSWHARSSDEALRALDVLPESGLTETEASARLASHGPNRISPQRGTPAWMRFLHQFHEPLVYILLAAVVVTALLGEWIDSSVIFAVVLVNAVIGFLQESRAEKAIESLSRMVSTFTSVRRGGHVKRVDAAVLVPGDIVLLQAGDCVPADLRLIALKNLQIDESGLTGESVPVQKQPGELEADTLLADRTNLAFAGTLITGGQGEGVVWATGDRTETGRIARLISEAVTISTPLTKKIAQLSRLLLYIILAMAAASFAFGVARGESPVDMFMAAVALAVGAIPEGLPAAVTIVLAIGVARMAKRRAIIRKLPAVETLGSTTVICSDKTGTLTENQMTVREVYAAGRHYSVSGTGYEPLGEFLLDGEPARPEEHPVLAECLRAGVLCNDAQVERGSDGIWRAEGDPTEAAMLVSAAKAGFAREVVAAEWPRMDVIPFDSEYMYHATLHEGPGGRMIYKVGAVEMLLPRCSAMLGGDGSELPIDEEAVRAAAEDIASRGLRVLALLRRPVAPDHQDLEHKHVSDGLTFLGLQGMIDPPRPEAVSAVKICQEAGIAVKMITGDHLITARAIAEQIGLHGRGMERGVVALSGRDLAEVSDTDLARAAEETDVFARVSPEQKLRLVQALQSRGHVVAMTGDGVNDAPALKQADIGVAMGIAGTEVAKGAADMVLTDDNFASIEAAVEEGRGVFDNLAKFIVWTLPTNAGEGLILLTAIMLGLGSALPVLPVQLLWVNMTTALFLGIMLVFEPKEAGLMLRPPRDPARPILTVPLLLRTGLVAMAMLGGGYWLYFDVVGAEGEHIDEARTAVVNVLVMVELAYLFACRSLTRSLWSLGPFTNRWALGGAAIMLGLQLLFTYTPVFHSVLHSAPIDAGAWCRIASVAIFAFFLVECEKWLRYHGRPAAAG